MKNKKTYYIEFDTDETFYEFMVSKEFETKEEAINFFNYFKENIAIIYHNKPVFWLMEKTYGQDADDTDINYLKELTWEN